MILELEKIYENMQPDDKIVTGFGDPLAYIKIEKQDSVLDIGSGNGRMCAHIADLTSERVVGIDVQKKMIDFAEERNAKDVRFILGDFMENDFLDASFDKVVSNCAFAHIEDKDKVIAEIHRILKKGGKFAFTDLTIKEPEQMFHAVSSDEWSIILNRSPFQQTGETYFVEEKRYFYKERYENMYYATFIGKK